MNRKHRVPPAVPVLSILVLILIVVLVFQGVKIKRLKSEIAYIPEIETITTEETALTLRPIAMEVKIEPENSFEPLDIPLSIELQEFTYEQCKLAEIDPNILFAIMYRESRYQEDAIGYNKNGSTDKGLYQINSVNWDWLAEEGFDIHTSEGNIMAAIRILGGYLEQYTLEEAIAAYAAGEQGMLNGNGFWYSEMIKEDLKNA